MEKEINEVKITYLAETGTGLVHLLMNNYDDNGRVLKTKHSNNCYIANALLVIVHDNTIVLIQRQKDLLN